MTSTTLDFAFDLDDPPKPYTILDHGLDTSGRKLLLTARMTLFLLIVNSRISFDTHVEQGEWMSKAGGGAADSEGYHDRAGNVDLHTSSLTRNQCLELAHKGRLLGGTMNLRGMGHDSLSTHCHSTLMGTKPSEASPGEPGQESEYIAGGDGLVGEIPDWEWRPDPLVVDFDFYAELRAYKEAQMPTPQDLLNASIGDKDDTSVGKVLRQMHRFVEIGAPNLRASLKDLAADVDALADTGATKDQVHHLRDRIKAMQDALTQLDTDPQE